MRRPAFYSRSPRGPQDAAGHDSSDDASVAQDLPNPVNSTAATAPRAARRRLWPALLMLVLAAGLGAGAALMYPQATHQLTQKDIDAAVLHTLQTATLPSPAARAAEIIRPSVVRVVAYGSSEKTTPDAKVEKRGRNLARGKPPEATADEVPGAQVERAERHDERVAERLCNAEALMHEERRQPGDEAIEQRVDHDQHHAAHDHARQHGARK